MQRPRNKLCAQHALLHTQYTFQDLVLVQCHLFFETFGWWAVGLAFGPAGCGRCPVGGSQVRQGQRHWIWVVTPSLCNIAQSRPLMGHAEEGTPTEDMSCKALITIAVLCPTDQLAIADSNIENGIIADNTKGTNTHSGIIKGANTHTGAIATKHTSGANIKSGVTIEGADTQNGITGKFIEGANINTGEDEWVGSALLVLLDLAVLLVQRPGPALLPVPQPGSAVPTGAPPATLSHPSGPSVSWATSATAAFAPAPASPSICPCHFATAQGCAIHSAATWRASPLGNMHTPPALHFSTALPAATVPRCIFLSLLVGPCTVHTTPPAASVP